VKEVKESRKKSRSEAASRRPLPLTTPPLIRSVSACLA
jgi:hypothetical protein